MDERSDIDLAYRGMRVVPVTKFLAIWHNGVNVMTETDKERKQRTGLSSNEMSDKAAAAVQKTPNRISLDQIRSKIEDIEYIHPKLIPHMTICVLLLENGFAVLGKSTPADPKNFNPELGEKQAREDAERRVWPLEAYLLREKLTRQETDEDDEREGAA